MKRTKQKIDKPLFIMLILLALISLVTISSAEILLPSYKQGLVLKQFLWYGIGFCLIYFLLKFGMQRLKKWILPLYIIGNILLILLLFFAEPINEARCWFQIPGIGSFQPSEFMKIILILMEANIIQEFYEQNKNPTWKQEFVLLIKIGIILLIPSILTFLEPDTGVVLIYLLITIVILFVSGLRYRWFFLLLGILATILSILLGLFFLNQALFVDLFGTSFFLRINRLLDWKNKSGFQLENGLASIGAGGMIGYGYQKTPIYFPEPQTDFIFAVFANNFGFIGVIMLIFLLIAFDLRMVHLARKTKKNVYKYIIAGIVGMLFYQQLQNIGMTFGLMPITGITLPFISYGGSSLMSYMFMMGVLFMISSENDLYKLE